MFSIFTYLFCAVISLWAAKHFHDAWSKISNKNYWDFSTFFFVMAIGFVIFPVALFIPKFTGIVLEVGLFFILLGFAFVLRLFVRFQNIKMLSPNVATLFIIFLALLNLIIGIAYAPVPVVQDSLIYWHTPLPSSISFGVLIVLFTVSMGITMLSNIRSVQKNKSSILLLGLAFLFGGASGIGTTAADSFWPLLGGYTSLFITFVFVTVFIVISLNKKE